MSPSRRRRHRSASRAVVPSPPRASEGAPELDESGDVELAALNPRKATGLLARAGSAVVEQVESWPLWTHLALGAALGIGGLWAAHKVAALLAARASTSPQTKALPQGEGPVGKEPLL